MASPPRIKETICRAGQLTLLYDRRDIPATAKSVLIQNQHATVALRLGDSTISASKGYRVSAGGSYGSDTPRQEFYGFSEGADLSVCCLFEVVDF